MVQVRLPEKDVKTVDNWVEEGRFKSRSDAIKTILHYYKEREETRKFWRMLRKRSEEAEIRKVLKEMVDCEDNWSEYLREAIRKKIASEPKQKEKNINSA